MTSTGAAWHGSDDHARSGGGAAGALLVAILETSDDAIYGQDAGGTVTTWNRAAERCFGYRGAEIVGQDAINLFPEHLRSDVQAVFDAVRAGDQVSHFETEILRKDGMPVPISLSLCPVHGPGGELVSSVVIARDITEQRLAQAALAEVEARVRESEALAHVGSWLWDLRTGTVQWSDQFHRIHGVDPVDFGGTLEAHLDAIHPDDRSRVQSAMQASVASGQPFEEEYRVVRPDGGVRDVRVRAQPQLSSAGTVVGLRGIGQDLTRADEADGRWAP
jgi:PAS domain S-box-containing protein